MSKEDFLKGIDARDIKREEEIDGVRVVHTRRKRPVHKGYIEKDSSEHKVMFLQDYTFRSPSAAAEVICWRPVNGWSKWKSEWKTLDELERND